jgi:DMSO/TMAO reductase YedYZ molybdopterin-dependent catalytic subunit
MTVESFSTGARIAGSGEGIGADELQLAARNHGLPLEALRYDVTPPGLHYVLVHYDIPDVVASEWRLSIAGCLEQPVTLDLDELRALPARTVRVTMECAGNGRARYEPRPVSQPWLVEAIGTAEWTGVPLADLLDWAKVRGDAVDVVFTGADHGFERGVEQDYQRSLSLADALSGDVLVAYQMNGADLPPQHGYPVRLVVPGWYGMAHVKWLTSIEVLDHEFDGFQNAVAYRLRTEADEDGRPVTRMEPRALLEPPGFPDFMSRSRLLHPGPVTLRGRCWSGWAPVSSVEVSADGGTTWLPAKLDPDGGERWAWRRFSCAWDATPGEHVLTARATDGSGRAQPLDADWNRGGFANNSAQRIPVLVL